MKTQATDREDVKTFTCKQGTGESRSKTSCPPSAPPCLFTVLLRQPGRKANVKGNKRILLGQQISMGRRLADGAGGTSLLMLSSPSLSPGHLSSADVHALSIPGLHPGHIW